MTHTFLFEPGVWTGAGTFWTEDGKATHTEGRTEITHREDCWLLAGSLRVQSSPPVEFVNHYFIKPPPPDGISKDATAAQSEEPDSDRRIIPAAQREGGVRSARRQEGDGERLNHDDE